MGLFRKKETYNEQLMRETGLASVQLPTLGEPEPMPQEADERLRATPTGDPSHSEPEREWVRAGTRGLPSEWDSLTTTTVPGFEGDRIAFVTLPGGDILVEEEVGDADVTPFADVVEQELEPPYRVVAARQAGDRWGIGAKRIEVATFDLPAGDQLSLSANGGELELRVDGEPYQGEIHELEELGRRGGEDYVVQADRLDGDLWEVRVTAL